MSLQLDAVKRKSDSLAANFDGQEPKRQRHATQPKSDFLYEMRPPV